MISSEAFVHPLALVEEGAHVGRRSRIWQFCVILPGATVGEDCNICAHCLVEGSVTIGSRVTVKSGVQLWDGATLEDDVFIGPNVTFTNDSFPRSRQPFQPVKSTVLTGASIGANATILPGVSIGRWAMVGAGSVVTRDVPDYALVLGNPARFRAWICRCGTTFQVSDGSVARCACGQSYRITGEQVIEVPANVS